MQAEPAARRARQQEDLPTGPQQLGQVLPVLLCVLKREVQAEMVCVLSATSVSSLPNVRVLLQNLAGLVCLACVAWAGHLGCVKRESVTAVVCCGVFNVMCKDVLQSLPQPLTHHPAAYRCHLQWAALRLDCIHKGRGRS
jgi:hypothetical protein